MSIRLRGSISPAARGSWRTRSRRRNMLRSYANGTSNSSLNTSMARCRLCLWGLRTAPPQSTNPPPTSLRQQPLNPHPYPRPSKKRHRPPSILCLRQRTRCQRCPHSCLHRGSPRSGRFARSHWQVTPRSLSSAAPRRSSSTIRSTTTTVGTGWSGGRGKRRIRRAIGMARERIGGRMMGTEIPSGG